MINDMGILREDSKKPALRVTPENLEKIKTRLSHLEEQANNPNAPQDSGVGSEISLCKLLVKAYTERLEIKAALKADRAGVITGTSSLATAVAKTLTSADFSSPEILLKKIISSCATDPTLRSQIQGMISDKDNPLRKVLVSVAGEKAIHGLNIATSPEGLAIANTLIGAGSVDIAKAFIEDPVGTLLANKALFVETASTAFDQFVALLDNKSATDSLIAMSDGKLQQADISLLRDILPLAKEVIAENTTATETDRPTKSPSKTAHLLAKIAEHVATRADLELAKLATKRGDSPALPIQNTLEQLSTGIDNSLHLLTKLTVGIPDTVSQKESQADANTTQDNTDQSWGGWLSGWGSAVTAGVSNVAVQATAFTLGDEAGLTLENAISDATEYVSDTASYVTSTVTGAASSIANIPNNIIATAVDIGLNAGASVAAGKIDTAIDRELNNTPKTSKDKATVTLNPEKLTEFMAQNVSLLSHFVAENPAVLDIMGQSVTAVIVTVSETLQDPTLGLFRNRQSARFTMLPNAPDVTFLGQCGVAALHKLNENGADGVFRNRATLSPEEKSQALCNVLKNSLGDIGRAIATTGDETAKKVGHSLINAGALLGSDLVTRSLGQSKALQPETLNRVTSHVQTKFHTVVLDKVSTALGTLEAAKTDSPKQEKPMQIPQSAAKVLTAYSQADLGSVGGMIGKVVNFVGLGAANSGLNMASQIIQTA